MSQMIETVAGSIIARSDATIPHAMLTPLLDTLGHIVGSRHATIGAHGEDESPSTNKGGALDGNVIMAFDATIVNILHRVDSIIADNRNWKVRRSKAQRLTETDVKTRLQKIKDNTAQAGQLLRPSVRLARSLSMAVTPEGKAQVSLRVPGGVVLGEGKSFGEALKDFDEEFLAGAPISIASDFKDAEVEEAKPEPE